MTDGDEPPLAEHVAPRVDEARLARQWEAVSRRVGPAVRRWPKIVLAASSVAVAAAAIAVVAAHPWRHPAPIAAPAAAARTITLPEGSRVTLEADAALSVERAEAMDVHLALASGAIDLDVTHREGRSFVVSAGGHDVIVVGTQLRVERSHDALTVAVTRGLVRVEGPSGTRMLGAGERWTTALPAPVTPPPSSSPASAPAPEVDGGGPVAIAEPTARELLSRATEARAAGHDREAAAAFDALRRRHRSDPRAGLAAFELGRIRLDTFRDPDGAAEAFADALQLSPHATFAEDAEARRIEALEDSGKTAACTQARDAYLKRHPAGLYVRQVSQRCTGH